MPLPQRRLPPDVQMRADAARMAAEGQQVQPQSQMPQAPQPIATNPGRVRPGSMMTMAPQAPQQAYNRQGGGQLPPRQPQFPQGPQAPQGGVPRQPGAIPPPGSMPVASAQQALPQPLYQQGPQSYADPRNQGALFATPQQGRLLQDPASSNLLGTMSGNMYGSTPTNPDDAAAAAIQRLLDASQGSSAADQEALQKAASAQSYNAGEGILARFGATGGGSSGATAALMGDARVRAALEAAQQMVDARQKDQALGIQAASVGLTGNNAMNQTAAEKAASDAQLKMLAGIFGTDSAGTAAGGAAGYGSSMTANGMRDPSSHYTAGPSDILQAKTQQELSNPNSAMAKLVAYTGNKSSLPVHAKGAGDDTTSDESGVVYGVDKNGNLYIVG